MNYSKIYYSIIEYRKLNVYDGYTETHHIKPVCLGGTNEKENLIQLSAKEHFICHLLLTKMYQIGTFEYYKMVHAFTMMSVMNTATQHRYISSRDYSHLKLEYSRAMSIAQTGSNNTQYGTKWIYNTTNFSKMKILKELPVPEGWCQGRVPKNENGDILKFRTIYKIGTGDSLVISNDVRIPVGWSLTYKKEKPKRIICISQSTKQKNINIYINNVIKYTSLRKIWIDCKSFEEFKSVTSYNKPLNSLQEAFTRFVLKRDISKEYTLYHLSDDIRCYYQTETKLNRKPMSDEAIENIRNSNLKNNTPERNARISTAKTGVKIGPPSAEHKQKLAAANLGKIKITNGFDNKTIQPSELDAYIVLGWYRGMIRQTKLCASGEAG